MYYVYLIECKDTSIYTGITTDLARRWREHQRGIGSRYTRAHPVKRLIHAELHPTRSAALVREAEIKRWKRERKIAL